MVAGPGRSGTSLFSGLVSRLGFSIPQPEVEADRTNPRGFGEPQWAVDFHHELLRSLQVQVDDGRPEAWELTARVVDRPYARRRLGDWLEEQFEHSNRVLVKDPRLAWFFELYRATASDLGVTLRVVTMLRHPAEVTRSRELAYGTRSSSTTKVAGWLNTMLAIELLTRGLPRAAVRYDDLLTGWSSALARAEKGLGSQLVSAASDVQLAEAGELVDHSLHRSRTDWEMLAIPTPLRELTERTYDALQRLVEPDLTSPSDPAGSPADELDELRAAYARYYDECADVARSRTIAARARERRKLAHRQEQEQARQPVRFPRRVARALRAALSRSGPSA